MGLPTQENTPWVFLYSTHSPNLLPMTKKYLKSTITKVSAGLTDFEFSCNYPEENPEGAVEDITKMLKYLGVFENLQEC
jgi:hypothetical protein